MIEKKKLRRIALNQQGLLKSNSFGCGKAATLRAIEHIAYVQIDTISVVERAHHHVLRSRVANYQPKFLDELVADRKVFEYWFHAAAWLPMQNYRFALPRMNALKNSERHSTQNSNVALRKNILARIRQEGPLRSRDFKDTRTGRKEWWDWKPAKHALEQLFMQGDLMVSRRDGFQKIYDLPERVIPDDVDKSAPTITEYASHLIDANLLSHGFVSSKMITYLRKGQALRAAVKEKLLSLIDAKILTAVTLDSGTLIYITNEMLESNIPRGSASVRILSPFDNAIIQRDRGRDIFDFDYQIECYVPAVKRQFGYFCLPILYHDRLVGRLDCKAHRKEKIFEIKAAHIEHKVDERFQVAMDAELQRFSKFNKCNEITGERPW